MSHLPPGPRLNVPSSGQHFRPPTPYMSRRSSANTFVAPLSFNLKRPSMSMPLFFNQPQFNQSMPQFGYPRRISFLTAPKQYKLRRSMNGKVNSSYTSMSFQKHQPTFNSPWSRFSKTARVSGATLADSRPKPQNWRNEKQDGNTFGASVWSDRKPMSPRANALYADQSEKVDNPVKTEPAEAEEDQHV